MKKDYNYIKILKINPYKIICVSILLLIYPFKYIITYNFKCVVNVRLWKM